MKWRSSIDGDARNAGARVCGDAFRRGVAPVGSFDHTPSLPKDNPREVNSDSHFKGKARLQAKPQDAQLRHLGLASSHLIFRERQV